MTQMTLADASLGEARKAAGLDRMEYLDRAFIQHMRVIAQAISETAGQVTTDDIRLWACQRGLYPTLPNAYGGIFRGKHWVAVGRQRSALPSNHGRHITVWRWVQS